MRVFRILSFCLVVVAPTLVAATYYVFIASDQFVSEAEFTVSSGMPPMSALDGVGALTGLPAVAIVQDTQIVTNFIHTRAAVERLEQSVHLRDLYSDPRADWWTRSSSDSPIEKFVKYWKKMSEASIVMPAGIVDLKVRAFTPEDAQRIAQATVEMCEALINELNERMNRDAVANAEQELQRSTQRLGAALAALEVARNESGMLETDKSALALNALVNEAKSSLLSLQGQYDAQLKYVSASAPQMQELNSRIEVTKTQIADIQGKLTSKGVGDPNDPTVATAMTKFGELDLEHQVAERLYAGAVAAVETARLVSESKLMYLKTFVSPVVPQQAQYPRRALSTLLAFAASLCAWGVLYGLGVTLRNYIG
jgi:capsular polysaccharide transport system permease protein